MFNFMCQYVIMPVRGNGKSLMSLCKIIESNKELYDSILDIKEEFSPLLDELEKLDSDKFAMCDYQRLIFYYMVYQDRKVKNKTEVY